MSHLLSSVPRSFRTITAVLLSGLVGLPIAAAMAEPAAAAVPAAPRCTLVNERQVHSEFASCLQVTVSFDRAPAVGQTAVLTVRVRAQAARAGTDVQVDLPRWLEFVDSAGMGVASARSRDGAESVSRASGRYEMAENSETTRSLTVRAIATGAGLVTARAVSTVDPGHVDGATDGQPLTVGTTAATSSLSVVEGPTEDQPVVAHARSAAPSGPSAPATAPLGAVAPPPPAAPPAGTTVCATGQFFYTHPDGSGRGVRNFQVRALDDDVNSGDDQLAVGLTDMNGVYNLCFNNADTDEGGSVDVYVKFLSENSRWRLQNDEESAKLYTYTSGVHSNVTTNVDFGGLQPAATSHQRGMHAFDAVTTLYNVIPRGANNCWDANDAASACRQYRINWTPTSTVWPHNDGNGGVHLAGSTPDSEHVVLHEISHALMDDVYEDDYPAIPNCAEHYMGSVSSAGCAWTEGFAEWLPAMAIGDKMFDLGDSSTKLEDPTWNYDMDFGDQVEGNVARAMVDISDAENESAYDRLSTGFPGTQYTTFLNVKSNTFAEFVKVHLPARGIPFLDSDGVASTDLAATAWYNTIDYAFRERLAGDVALEREWPELTHNYMIERAASWGYVAVRAGTNNVDLTLYADKAQTSQLEKSALPAPATDYIAIDGRRSGQNLMFPRVSPNGDGWEYAIEWRDINATVGDGTFFLTHDSMLEALDIKMTGGLKKYFRIVPSSNLKLDARLHRSVSGTASSYEQLGSARVAVDTSAENGEEVSFSYTDSATQTDGLVVLSTGTGSSKVYVDSSAPSAGITIDGGAAGTKDNTVDLTLSGADAQTGIKDMRISTDGVFDSESFVPFSSSATAVVPAGEGTKTVWVQTRNNSLITKTAFDKINLDSRPDLVVWSVGNPQSAASRGDSFPMVDFTKNEGATAAGASTTKFYLSLDTVRDSADAILGSRPVPMLVANASQGTSTSLTVPMSAKAGQYFVLGCADQTFVVNEFDETNNCTSSTGKITIRVPDLVVNAVSNPPATGKATTVFKMTDTTANVGDAAVTASTGTRYYLSQNNTWDSSDRLLMNSNRSVPALAAGASHTGEVTVMVPSGTPQAIYFVLACADDTHVANENSETNNCKASATKITIT